MSDDYTWDQTQGDGSEGYLLTEEEAGTGGFQLIDQGEDLQQAPGDPSSGPPAIDMGQMDEVNAATLKAMDQGDGAALREYGMYIFIGDNHDPAVLEYVDAKIRERGLWKGGVWMDQKGGITGPGRVIVTNAVNQANVEAAIGRVSKKTVKFK